MKDEICLLVITNEPFRYEFLKTAGLSSHCQVYFSPKDEGVFSLLDEKRIRVVILDVETDGNSEFRTLGLIKARDPLIEIIVAGPSLSSERTIEWINQGASDYLISPLQADALQLILMRVNERRDLRRETYRLEQRLEKKYQFQGMVGKSPFMLEIFSLIENIAKYFSTVLISGETGTGKEMVARAIHHLSPVRDRKFVIADCASLPDNLFESELFGYLKGAFTGADRDKKGLFEEAQGGMIFLDEIGEVPLMTQAKLLRVLETHQFRPLGSNINRKVDVLVITASNRDLKKAVENGKFREDLFHRLNKVEIHLPPLKSRPEDLPLLARHFLAKYNKKFEKQIRGLSRQVQKLFLSYHWPGNVRELENVIERAAIFCKKEFIDLADLPDYLQDLSAREMQIPFIDRKEHIALKNLEKEYIQYLLKVNSNNLRKTALILEISRTTLYNKIKKYGLQVRNLQGA